MPSPRSEPDRPAFAHASEAELARILDFYAVRWEYEPHTFPILWALDGSVVESFSPDFWLPDLDLYVELTTLKQSLVRKKNRKLRRLRELYPDVRVKLFYGRDFRALMLKYGKLALIGGMTGTLGQAPPAGRTPGVPAVASVLEIPQVGEAVHSPETTIETAAVDVRVVIEPADRTAAALTDSAAAAALAALASIGNPAIEAPPAHRRRRRRRHRVADRSPASGTTAGGAQIAADGPAVIVD
jgi:hypoxanthine phosphoribosyltransferase